MLHAGMERNIGVDFAQIFAQSNTHECALHPILLARPSLLFRLPYLPAALLKCMHCMD